MYFLYFIDDQLDIMDGHFVDNISFGPVVLQSVRKRLNNQKAFFDCHLMVTDPGKWLEMLKKASVDNITFHIESCKTIDSAKSIIDRINIMNMKASIALKPNTPVETLFPLLDDKSLNIFMILVMTVEPGFGGQKFLLNQIPKVKTLRSMYPYLNIEVDGGLGEDTIEIAANSGANVFFSIHFYFNPSINSYFKTYLLSFYYIYV